MEMSNVRIVAEGLQFPEGPVAMSDGSVVVVEIGAGRVTRVRPDGVKETVAEVGHGPNGAAIGADGALYVCNSGGHIDRGTPSIQRVDLKTGRFETLYAGCDGQPFGAPNDIVFDETGNFWFTDFYGGAIFYAAPDGSKITRALSALSAPNGVGLSPDGRTLYWAQTHTRQVFRRRVLSPGELAPSPGYSVGAAMTGKGLDRDCLLIGLPGARELDSLAVDSQGAICVGSLLESGITVISADGASEVLMTLPDFAADYVVTNICFGGPDLKTAYITCSGTGRLVACDWPVAGLKLAFNA